MASEKILVWQVQRGAANGTQATAGNANTVKFNPTPILKSGNYVYKTEIMLRKATPENPAVNVNNNEIQDMGAEGIDYQIVGEITDAKDSGDIPKLVNWYQASNATTGFTKGRFGLSHSLFTFFNVTPTSTYGYHIADMRFILQGEPKGVCGIVLTLRLGGDLDNAI